MRAKRRYKRTVAFHEAGHAAAIHFSNRQKNLPPIYFQIIFKDVDLWPINGQTTDPFNHNIGVARIKGGRLIEMLPLSFEALKRQETVDNSNKVFQYTDDYRLAFEADIINLLVGPLAEARYTAQVDNKPFHQQLLTVQALQYYGGDDDLAVVY